MRRIPFEIWLAALILLLHVYPVFVPANSLMSWFPSDDAFYYFKTAQNIAEGHGITFDGLGRDSGFHPLWMLIITPLFALARYDLILPLRLVVVLSSLLNAATAVILYRLAKRFLAAPAAAFVALFWAFYPTIHSNVVEMGLESGLSAFFIVLLLYRVAGEEFASPLSKKPEQRWIITGFIGALTILARLDNVFLVAVLGAWLVLRPARLRYLVITDLVSVALGTLWSYQTVVGFGPQYEQFATSAVFMVAAALVIRLALYYLAGLYMRPRNPRELMVQLCKAAAAVLAGSVLLAGTMLALQALHIFAGFPRRTLIYEAGFALVAVLVIRLATALLLWRGPLSRTSPAENDEMRWSRLWQPALTRAICYFAPIGLILLLYMAASQSYFGTPMPVSGQIKRWWGVLPNVIYGLPTETFAGLLGFIPKASPWSLVDELIAHPQALPKALRGLLYGLPLLALAVRQCQRMSRGTHLLAVYPLFIGNLAQLISYTGTGYLHMRVWYWVAPMLCITLVLGLLLDALLCWLEETKPFDPLTSKLPIAPGAVLAALLTAAVVIYGSYSLVRRMPMTVRADKADRYLWGIREMERMTEPGSYIGSTGGGVIAYFAQDRKIINMDGLMNTYAYYQALRSGHAAEYLDQIGLDYVYTSGYVITSSDPYFQFKGRLEAVKTFEGSTLFHWVKK